jgi:hypothetical protein
LADGSQVFKYLLIYLFAGAGSEFMSYLITDDIIKPMINPITE